SRRPVPSIAHHALPNPLPVSHCHSKLNGSLIAANRQLGARCASRPPAGSNPTGSPRSPDVPGQVRPALLFSEQDLVGIGSGLAAPGWGGNYLIGPNVLA